MKPTRPGSIRDTDTASDSLRHRSPLRLLRRLSHQRPPRPLRLPLRRAGLAAALLLAAACVRHAPQDWQLTDVDGHLPDLRFALVADNGRPMDQDALRGKVVMVFFGYTHCPDICPTTLAKLSAVLKTLGPVANDARIAFISVDPARDDPASMHAYVDAFDAAHAIGLSGSGDAIEDLARRYRVAYAAERRDAAGQYEVTHSGAVYLFDRQGHARLIASVDAAPEKIEHDLRLLLATSS